MRWVHVMFCIAGVAGLSAGNAEIAEIAESAEIAEIAESAKSTAPPPPRPYAFAYTAGRFPGHADRHHAEVSDGSGVVRGQYSYVDPRHQVRTVEYVADREGFHPVLSHNAPAHPRDTIAVQRARDKHEQLYNEIAHSHANHHPEQGSLPRESASVLAARAAHAQLFRVIAEQHQRIAAERELLQDHSEPQL